MREAPRPFDPDRLDGRDAALIASFLPFAQSLCETYFRLCVEGVEHVAPRGPALYVGNHNNGLAGPESLCTLATLWRHTGPDAPVYALAHDFAMRHLTPFGRVIHRFGALRASPLNARRALDAGASLIVYPGGDLEAYRHFRRRDEIILGERTGFIRVAQETGAPVIPVVAHGAHRSALIVAEGRRIARHLRLKRWARLERFPIAVSLPWGVALGPWLPYLPLPFPIRLRFLPAMYFDPHDDPARLREQVRAVMQSALDAMARKE
jgi:1-acyl-sn-glycerol-3-phosphate acyltransferase